MFYRVKLLTIFVKKSPSQIFNRVLKTVRFPRVYGPKNSKKFQCFFCWATLSAYQDLLIVNSFLYSCHDTQRFIKNCLVSSYEVIEISLIHFFHDSLSSVFKLINENVIDIKMFVLSSKVSNSIIQSIYLLKYY